MPTLVTIHVNRTNVSYCSSEQQDHLQGYPPIHIVINGTGHTVAISKTFIQMIVHAMENPEDVYVKVNSSSESNWTFIERCHFVWLYRRDERCEWKLSKISAESSAKKTFQASCLSISLNLYSLWNYDWQASACAAAAATANGLAWALRSKIFSRIMKRRPTHLK